MPRALEPFLEEVNELLYRMGGLCEAILGKSWQAVVERDVARAQEVRRDDLEIDQIELQVDGAVLRALALQAPVAADLRRLFAAKSIATDLERVGDLARNVAKSAERLAGRAPIAIPAALEALQDEASSMLHEALDAFVARDAARARALLPKDDEVDEDQDRVIRQALSEIVAHPEQSSQELDLILIAKNLERVADHATNIAEDVILVVEAHNVKHADKLGRAVG